MLASLLVTEARRSTCNRPEVYAVVDASYGGLSVIVALCLNIWYVDGGLRSTMSPPPSEQQLSTCSVASGLDSAVIGEQQVLGQVRRAVAELTARSAARCTTTQRALSVAKRVHSETAIDAVSPVPLRGVGRPWNGRAQIGLVGGHDRGGDRRQRCCGTSDPCRRRQYSVLNRSLSRAQRLAEDPGRIWRAGRGASASRPPG